jgi:hypothetical protein
MKAPYELNPLAFLGLESHNCCKSGIILGRANRAGPSKVLADLIHSASGHNF